MERELVAIEPNVWKPTNEGDSVEGILIAKKEDVGINKSKAYSIENKKEHNLVWGSTVLDDRMLYVNVGDYCKITYIKTTQNKKGQPLKIFKVEKEKRSTQPHPKLNDIPRGVEPAYTGAY